MLSSTPGIVLRKVSYSNSSAIVTVYTKKFGQTPFMVRGIGKKGGKSAAIQPLSRIEISCSFREKSRIQSALSLWLRPDSSNYLFHPIKAGVALFLAEMLYRTLKEESPDTELFDFLDNSLDYYSKADYSANFHLVFLMKLSRYFGFFPADFWSEKNPYFDLIDGSFVQGPNHTLHTLDLHWSRLISALIALGFEGKDGSFTNPERRKLLSTLIEYYQIHLEGLGEIKSLAVLSEMFSEK